MNFNRFTQFRRTRFSTSSWNFPTGFFIHMLYRIRYIVVTFPLRIQINIFIDICVLNKFICKFCICIPANKCVTLFFRCRQVFNDITHWICPRINIISTICMECYRIFRINPFCIDLNIVRRHCIRIPIYFCSLFTSWWIIPTTKCAICVDAFRPSYHIVSRFCHT